MKKHVMRRILHTALAVAAAAAIVLSSAGKAVALANDEYPNDDRNPNDGYSNYFDISDRVLKIRAGESYTFPFFYSRYDYTYFITGSTSDRTYCECDWKAAGTYPTLHIGADETGKNVFFYFYADDYSKNMTVGEGVERYAVVEVYVQPADPSQVLAAGTKTVLAQSGAVGFTGGSTGTLSLIREDTVAMLYDAKKTPLASFSVNDGSGAMPKLSYGGTVQQNGLSYFTITTSRKGGLSVRISASDKAVMLSKGYAGVNLNGTITSWP